MSADLFVGFGMLVVLLVFAYFFYLFSISIKNANRTDEIMHALENACIRQLADEKGINIDKEMVQESILDKIQKQRTFRNAIRKQIYKKVVDDEIKPD